MASEQVGLPATVPQARGLTEPGSPRPVGPPHAAGRFGPMPDAPDTLEFGAADGIPNHPRWPLLLYRAAFPADADAAIARFAEHGWRGAWVDGVFPYPHYHPNAHEVLAVVAGAATVRFGGSAGREVRVEAGDVAVLPAGTGHQRIDAEPDFQVVGAYPEGQEDFQTRRPDDGRPPAERAAMADVPRPTADPVHGVGGPLFDLWPA